MSIHVCGPDGKYIASYPGNSVPETCPSGSYAVETAPPDAGATWDGDAWVPSEPVEYRPLEPYQFHAMLELAGHEEAVKTAIASLPDAKARAVAKAKLERRPEFNREDELVLDLSAAIGITPEDLNEMWLEASEL